MAQEKCKKCGLYYESPTGFYAPCGHRVWDEHSPACKVVYEAAFNVLPHPGDDYACPAYPWPPVPAGDVKLSPGRDGTREP